MLHRAERAFDPDVLRAYYANKRVLITGAAGSIGSALALDLARFGCAHLAVLDQFDHGLIDVVERVQRLAPSQPLTDILCDIRDAQRLDVWIRKIEPDVVFHAAALKHVHLGERHAAECVLTNLVGASHVLQASVRAGAGQFVLISSDKAAEPLCVMGATKRLAELHLLGFLSEQSTQTRLNSVRFGNVLGSQGSVLPRFQAQIEAGGPLEVTHPEMERFFMSPREAVGLILSTGALEEHGAHTYFMDMGDPVSILDLGRELVRQSGKDVGVAITGLRPGEKLKEQLADQYEAISPTPLEGVFRVAPISPDAGVRIADVAHLEAIARTMDNALVRQRVLMQLDERLGRRERAAS